MNIWEIIWDSGPIVKFVLFLLVVLSIVSWGVVFYYFRTYKKIKRLNGSFLKMFFNEGFLGSKSMDDFDQKISLFKGSPLLPVWKMFFREFRSVEKRVNEKEGLSLAEHLSKGDLSNFERSLEQGIDASVLKLDKHRSILANISSVAPFVGLFGTVWGIINSFNGLSEGGGSLESVAPGIAEALVATAVGLFAAIPASWFYNHFSRKLREVKFELLSFSKDLLNYLKYFSI